MSKACKNTKHSTTIIHETGICFYTQDTVTPRLQLVYGASTPITQHLKFMLLEPVKIHP